MAQVTLQLKVNVAWWVRWYLSGVLLTSRITGLQPDLNKVTSTVMRGITLEVQ